MTEQEQKSIMAEATLLAEGTAMEVHTYQDERADYVKKTFTTFLGISIWYGNEIVAVLHSVSAWNAFKSVASIIAEGGRIDDAQWEIDRKDPALQWEMSQGTYKQERKTNA